MSRQIQSGFLALLILLTCGIGEAQVPPPVHQVADRWTAWNPPPVPEDSSKVYIIKSGDTLWDIASTLLGDPYLWPQLWEQNQYIADAHWIYPGDPLLLGPEEPTELASADGVVGQPLDQGAMTDDDPFASVLEGEEDWQGDFADPNANNVPIPLGSEADIYCSGFIGDLDEAFPYSIAGSEYEFLTPTLDPQRDSEVKGLFGKADTQKYLLDTGDILYLDGGRDDGLSAGEVLTIVEPREKINHPLKNDVLGRYYRYLGRVRVLSVQQDTSIAEIVRSCHPITVGTQLRLFEPEPVPLRRKTPMRPVNFPARPEELEDAPSIVKAEGDLIALGRGYLVYIDQGEAQDVLPGDIFTIYRRARRGFPPIVLGELAILSVQENSALANIVESRYTVHVGDAVLIK